MLGGAPDAKRTHGMTIAEKVYCAVLAFTGLAAVILQCYWGVLAGMRDGSPFFAALVNVLSYFTILTNILVSFTLIVSLIGIPNPLTSARAKTAVLSYILAVGLVYEAVLRKLWDPQGLHRVVDTILHDCVPIAFLVYWITFVPKLSIPYSSLLRWALYPLAYLLYSTIRGAVSGFFPYPFVDFPQIGWTRWTVNVLVMLALFIGIGALLITLERALARSGRRRIVGLRNQLS